MGIKTAAALAVLASKRAIPDNCTRRQLAAWVPEEIDEWYCDATPVERGQVFAAGMKAIAQSIHQNLKHGATSMKYLEYDLYRNNTELDLTAYKALIKDGMTADQTRLNAIVDVFISLNVPRDYDGDIEEIHDEGLLEIENGNHAGDMLEYAKLIWAMPDTLSDAVYHVLEQLIEAD